MNRIRAILATAAVGLVAGLALAAPAQATETTPEPVCGTWQLRGTTGAYPAIVFGPTPAGAEVKNERKAELVKPTGEAPGVEFAAYNLDVTGPATVTATVDLSDGAEAISEAVRMFAYAAPDADTINDAPDVKAVATSDHNTLTFVAPDGVGTLGFTYDSSNATAGKVTVMDVKINDRPVSFTKCPEPEESPSASPSPTKPPTKAPARPTATPSELPLTGPGDGINPLAILLPMGAVLVLGGVGFVLVRRSRHRFVA